MLSLRYACVVAILLPLQLIFRFPLPRTGRQWFDLCTVGFLIQFVYFSMAFLSMKTGLSAGGIAVWRTLVSADKIGRSEERTSELQSLMRNSYAVFCLKKKKIRKMIDTTT